jgi:Putative peptidoglycan binding domain
MIWKRLYRALVVVSAALIFVTGAFGAPRRHKAKRANSSAAGKKTGKTAAHPGKKSKGRKVSGRKPRKSNLHYRLAHMQPSPERVQEIQQALIQAGDLQPPASGRWDSSTRDAMSRYQETNGFAVTGLPDSKSLMKMGLGPHPLPADVVSSTEKSAGSPDVRPGAASPSDKPTDPGPSKGGDGN